MDITFFGLFLLIGFIGSIILFYIESSKRNADGKKIGDWVYQLLYFLYAIFSFAFLIFYSLMMISEDFVLGLDHNNIVLDDMDINNLVWTTPEIHTKSTEFIVYNFENIGLGVENLVEDAHFCFYYNNTDNAGNVVRVTNGVVEISDYYYIKNSTAGSACVSINTSYIEKNSLLGLVCLDCSVVNPLTLPNAVVSSIVLEIHITKGNPLTYDFHSGLLAHAFWIETSNSVGKIVYEWFFRIYLLGIGGFILAFGYRWGYKYVSEDYDEIFT